MAPRMPALARRGLAICLALTVGACIGTIPPLPVGILATAPPGAATPERTKETSPADGRFAFAPLTGAPQPIADRLAAAIASASLLHNVPLAPFAHGNATYIVKGYLSAVTQGGGTRAIYVWDVLDSERTRLNRITGSVEVPVTADNPWDAIGGATLDRVAAETIAALAAWRVANGI